jgi:hypothetical protein
LPKIFFSISPLEPFQIIEFIFEKIDDQFKDLKSIYKIQFNDNSLVFCRSLFESEGIDPLLQVYQLMIVANRVYELEADLRGNLYFRFHFTSPIRKYIDLVVQNGWLFV